MTEQPIQERLAADPSSPWYRPPPGVDKGTPRNRSRITAGLLVTNDEARRWFKEKYGLKLADHHRQDMNIPLRLNRLLDETGIGLGCCFAPRRFDSYVSDFIVITQRLSGHWVNDGPDNYEEVMMEDVKPIPTEYEENVKRRLEAELGIKTTGFKSYFE